jgi:ElaB/YqjD/DUF883 family membrane-anchored ribosome-binding protein
LDKVKSKLASLEGERKALLDRLKKEFGVDSVEDAVEKRKQVESLLKKKRARLDKLVEEIEKELDQVESRMG